MKSTCNIFFKYLSAICAIAVFQLLSTDIADAAVVQRGRVSVSRAPASRKPVAQKTAEPEPEIEPEIEPETEPETETTPTVDISAIVEIAGDITSKFGDASDDDAMSKAMAREKKKNAAIEQQKQTKIKSATIQSTANQCNDTLRKCMAEKCGDDFTDCANDSTAQLDAKLSACRGKSKCSGTEYDLFSNEILADIDANRVLGTYGQIMSCGIDYNNCIIKECATSPSEPILDGCLSLADGNAAIEKCKFIADRCERYDNGLAARALSALAELRVDAEEQIASDEARLYALRDEMSAHCDQMGAAFDERTLNCIYSIKFIAGSDSTIFASKKALAGSTFICEPDWFGIDITTFRENVYRHVRQQSSATAGMLGAGVGIAGGALSSGAIGRAIETTKAKNATKAAEQEYSETYGEVAAQAEEQAKEKQAKTEQKAERKEAQAKKQAERKEKCEMAPGAKKMTRDKSGACVPEQCQKGYVYAFYGNDITCKKLDCKDGQIQNQRGDACIDDCTKSDLNKQDGAAGVTYSEKQRKCIITRCKVGYTLSDDQLSCIKKAPKERNKPKK